MLKISWGTKIALLYVGFVVLIVSLVWGSMHQSFDLVSADYYKQELGYQKVIEASKNQSTLTAPVSIHTDGTNVVFAFPVEFTNSTITGTVQFYSDVNTAWDKDYSINCSNNSFSVPAASLHTTAYKVKISWTADNKSYYQETAFNFKQ